MQAMRRVFLIAATCRLRVSVVRPTLAAEDGNTRRKSNMSIGIAVARSVHPATDWSRSVWCPSPNRSTSF